MSGKSRGLFWRASVFGIALYVAFLLTSPFEHHDLACHLNTPFHCTACTLSLVGADPHPPAVFDGSHQADAGSALVSALLAQGVLLPVYSKDRSPPA